MAEKLPQFESTVTVQPGPIVSEAPSFEAAAKVAGNLSDMVDKNLQRKADQQAVAQGGIAGEDIGFKPLPGGGRATEVYNLAALHANKYALAADIGTNMQNLTGELSKNVNGNETLDEFRTRAQGYAQGLLSNVPKANEPYAKNLLQAHANAGLTKLQSLVTKQNNEFAFVNYHQNRQTLTDIMSNAAFHGDGPIATHNYALLKKQTEDGIKAGWLTPVQASRDNLSADQSYNTNRLLYKYQQAQQADKTFMRGGKTDEAKIMDILNRNSDKNFVQRILHPEGKPVLDVGKGEIATHEMVWQNVEGKSVVFPTVIEDKTTGTLKKLSPKDALAHAMATNQFISAKDDKEAAWLSSNYKKIWDIKGKNISLKDQYTLPTTKFRRILMKDKSYDKIFSVQDRLNMMKTFDQLDKVELDKTNMTAAHLKNLTDNLLFKVAHGGEAEQTTVATVMLASKDPEDLQHKIDLAKQEWNIAGSHQYDSIDQQAAASSDLKTITPEVVARSDSLDFHNTRLGAAKQIDNFKNLRLSDSAAQVQNSPVLQHAFQDINNGELKMTKEQAIVNYLKNLKQPDNKIRVQRNDQSASQVQSINQMAADPQQGDDAVLGALVDRRKSDPAVFHYYFNGLMDNGLSPKYQTMMNMWMNPANRSNIDIYNTAWKSAHTSATGKTLPPGSTGSILNVQVKNQALHKGLIDIDATIKKKVAVEIAPFVTTLQTGAADNHVQIQQVTDDVTNVMKYLFAEKGDDLDTAKDKAYDMIIGKTFPVINGTYRVPFDIDSDQVKAKMHEMDLAIRRGETDLKLVAGEGQAFAEEQKQNRTGFMRWVEDRGLFYGGSWTNNPSGKGYIKLTVDGNKIYDNKTGKPYGFDTDDMKIKPGVVRKGLFQITPSELVGKPIL